jgi:membrane-associated phospholipid phosphatase
MIPFWLSSSLLLIHLGYIGSFLFLNQYHLDILDNFMLQVTHFGDGAFLIPLFTFILLWKKPGVIITMIIAALVSGIVTYSCKNFLFSSWNRPLLVVGHPEIIHTVNQYLLYRHSFPSGHSICIATIITALAVPFYKSKPAVFILSMFMLLVSYSRIYLGVHFLADVLAGNLIGITISLTVILLWSEQVNNWVKGLSPSKAYFVKITILVLSIVTLLVNTCYG